jgi:phosphate transport system substrate-binding protein
MASFQAAAGNADWSVPDFAASLIDTPGAESWPIMSPTFILLPTNPQDVARSASVMRFFDWAYREGKQLAAELEYVALPDQVAEAIRKAWAESVKGPNGQPGWPAR